VVHSFITWALKGIEEDVEVEALGGSDLLKPNGLLYEDDDDE